MPTISPLLAPFLNATALRCHDVEVILSVCAKSWSWYPPSRFSSCHISTLRYRGVSNEIVQSRTWCPPSIVARAIFRYHNIEVSRVKLSNPDPGARRQFSLVPCRYTTMSRAARGERSNLKAGARHQFPLVPFFDISILRCHE